MNLSIFFTNEHIRKVVLAIFLVCFIFAGFSQETSMVFDSIHKLPEKNIDKLPLYRNLFEKYRNNNDFKQLGSETHQLAKFLYKENIDSAIFYNQLAIDAKLKVDSLNFCSLKRSYFNAGFYHRKKKEYTKAIDTYFNVLKFPDCEGFDKDSKKFIMYSHVKRGDTYFKNKDFYLAASDYEKSLAFIDVRKVNHLIKIYTKAGKANKNIRSQTSGKKALAYFLKADSIYSNKKKKKENELIHIYQNIAGQYVQNGRGLEKSLTYFNKALMLAKQIQDSSSLKSIYLNMGIAYQKKDLKKSQSLYKESLKFQQKKDKLRKRTFLVLGENASLGKSYLKAQQYFLASLSLFLNKEIKEEPEKITTDELNEVLDKELLLELFRSQMENWDRLLSKNSSTEVSSKIIKKAKQADQLIDIMLKQDLSHDSKLLLRDLASEIYILGLEACYQSKNIETAFHFIEKNKALLLLGTIRNEKNRSKSNQSYFSNPNFTRVISINEVNVKEDQVVLNYIMAERLRGELPHAYGLCLTKNNKIFFKIEETNLLINSVKQLRNKLNKPFETEEDQKNYFNIANEVYELLMPKNIQQEIQGKKIVVLGDHIISFVPFEALITDKITREYLIEKNEIAYDYSLTFKTENKIAKSQKIDDFLGIAPIEFSEELIRLKESEKEIKEVEKLYSGKLLTKSKASLNNFVNHAKDYKIIHLATHADASDSISPWIAFSDRKLNLVDFDTIKTNADLVLLSACNTSIGKIKRGEGVMSLARGFFASGAKAVIPSLWKVNDKSTTLITSEFYKNLSKGQTKSKALRGAKLKYLKNNIDAEASPYYWASLIVVGNTDTIPSKTNYSYYLLAAALLLILLLFFYYKKRNK